MTPEQLTHLRRLLANGDTLAGSHELAAAAVNALPELLAAAEREQKLLEALQRVLWYCNNSADKIALQTCVRDVARAALAEGGAK